MAIVKVELPPELDEKFRKKVMEVYGYRKGSISRAMIDAISRWVEQESADTHNYVNYNEIRERYPDKYVILLDDRVIMVRDTLEEIYDELPTIKREKYTLLTPVKNRFNQARGRRLGWRMKRQH